VRHVSPLAAGALALAFAFAVVNAASPARSVAGAEEAPRWIIVGGGPSPAFNQVSIEQDVALAAGVLGAGGRILFAGGAGTHGVQVRAGSRRDAHDAGDLRALLGDLFDPRRGRDAVYRPTHLGVDAPAHRDEALGALRAALAGRAGEPLTLVLAGHGDRGDDPASNALELWSEEKLTARDLAQALDAGAPSRRPVRVIATSCFSGGFAEIAFAGADAQRGAPAATPRCGLFAATWDLEASGCDPNPSRRAQEGYGLHFFHALAGQDREGRALPPRVLDLDGDGRVSLLEAHTRVRVTSTAADVPTTTSERWLRHVAPSSGPRRPLPLPEEDAVVTAMAKRVELTGKEDTAAARLSAIEADVAAAEDALATMHDREQRAYARIAGLLLARWPVLDDPWHPEHAATLERHGDDVARFLRESAELAAWEEARDEANAGEQRVHEIERKAAPYRRLVRAIETRDLAARLHARGGPAWAHYRALLDCERGDRGAAGPGAP
jgi:hypothetical protein